MFQGFKQYLWSIQDWDARSLQSSRAFSAFFWIVCRMSPSTLWLLSFSSLFYLKHITYCSELKSIHWWLYRQHVIAETSQLGKQEPMEPRCFAGKIFTTSPRCDCVVSWMAWDSGPRMRRRARNVCSMRRTSWGHWDGHRLTMVWYTADVGYTGIS